MAPRCVELPQEAITIDIERNETLEALARYRFTAIRHAAELLNDDGTVRANDASSAAERLPGLVAASLEELKVAEEELRAQNAALESQRAAMNERTRHYRELFLQSPAPTLVSDIFGTIIEVNLAAARLLRRAPDFLTRKPIAVLIPPHRRDEFRRQFTHFGLSNEPRQWHFALNRNGDVPIDVCATVQLVNGLGPTSSGVLYWLISTDTSPLMSGADGEATNAG